MKKIFVYALAFSLILIVLFSVYFNNHQAQADIALGLVGYWNFDEISGTIATDSSGNNNNGTLVTEGR